ncbi:MAG TPA: glycosyl hydrolase 108 family protein [Candidatus Binataceae bacterium]|nr:glycosyl hydrolase 108 family protein [Candidatus Binataceae bacterium]
MSIAVDDASALSEPPTESYSPEFLAAVTRVLGDEGGTETAPDDPGGVTRFGISAREYPALDIAHLTRDAAIAIYHRDYWRPFGFDAAPGAIAAKAFDLAVNIGPPHAIGCLQRALRASGHRVTEDNVLGPETAAAAHAADPLALMAALRSEAAGYYRVMAAIARDARPDADREFLAGWLNRAYE